MTEYCLCEKNIVGNMHEEKEYYDKLSVVIICLNEQMEAEEGGIHEFLNILLSSKLSAVEKKEKLETKFGVKMSKELVKGEENDMCNLGEAIYEEGISKGFSQGITQGKAEGENRLNLLNQKLVQDGRFEELIQAITDRAFRQTLFVEYGIR